MIFLSYRLRFLDANQARWSFLLKHKCGVMTAKKRCRSSQITELSTLWFVGFQPFLFLSYYFLEFDEFIFSFQDTYNSRLKEKYENEPLTHPDLDPDLWLEVGSSGGPDKNQVYGLFNTTVENLWTIRSVSIIGCSQSIFRPTSIGSNDPS